MKKILIALTITLSCLGINKVSASTYELSYSDTSERHCDFFVDDYDYLIELGFEINVQTLYQLIIEKYNEEYASTYPYFVISLSASSSSNCNYISSFDKVGGIGMSLYMYSDIPSIRDTGSFPSTTAYMKVSYDASKTTYTLPSVYIDAGSASHSSIFLLTDGIYNPLGFFVSNFETTIDSADIYNVAGNSNFTINPGDIIKPYYTVENAFQDNYLEINLNDYAYVALALKDYNQKEFSTSVYVKGQYCLTPVYNYGMTERKDILTGSQVDRCSPYYDNYTPIRTYILDSDLQNHAIYYLKSYDTSKDNYVKIDTTVFDVTLITEEEKDNPYVTVDGKTYPTISYDKLTDTATKSEDEDYISGASKEFDFSSIFTAPLEFLEDIWSSITSVFSLITELFSLLPPVMQNFLYASFTLAIVLGLIKMLF